MTNQRCAAGRCLCTVLGASAWGDQARVSTLPCSPRRQTALASRWRAASIGSGDLGVGGCDVSARRPLDRPCTTLYASALLAAVIGSWRVTAVVGACSMVVAFAVGVSGPLAGPELAARLLIIVVAVAAAGTSARSGATSRPNASPSSTNPHPCYTPSNAASHRSKPTPSTARPYDSSQATGIVGGDFVDVVTLPDDRLGVVIGDVCGHGPKAALGTAVRAAWRTIVLTHAADPAGWLELLHQAQVPLSGGDTFVTMCTGVIDTAAGRAELVSAGHPWPVVVTGTVSDGHDAAWSPARPRARMDVPISVDGTPASWCSTPTG